jgi:hypothetical protein
MCFFVPLEKVCGLLRSENQMIDNAEIGVRFMGALAPNCCFAQQL